MGILFTLRNSVLLGQIAKSNSVNYGDAGTGTEGENMQMERT